jgi:hypothetical protein
VQSTAKGAVLGFLEICPAILLLLLLEKIGINLDLAMPEIPSIEYNTALSVRTFRDPKAMQKSQAY